MSLRAAGAAFISLFVLVAAAPAANPRITLKLENVNAAEAAERLGDAAGVEVRAHLAGEPPPRASFDWTNVTFGRALRQLCERFSLEPQRQQDGYLLQPSNPPGAPPKRVGLVERDGVRLYVRGATLQTQRALNFVGDANDWGDSQLQLQLFAELGERDGDSVAGFENVTARDDQGTVLRAPDQRPSYGGYHTRFPDEWSGSLVLTPPHPRAKKLATLDADLMLYRTVRPARVEIPLPLTAKSVRREVGDWLIAVSQYRAEQPEEPDDDEGLPNLAARSGSGGPAVRVRLYYPVKSRVSWQNGGWHPYLVTQSGRRYHPVQSGGAGAGNGELTMSDSRLVYPKTDTQPVKLVWDLVEKADPVRLFTFRMTDIPLPAEPALGGGGPEKPVPVPPAPLPPADTEHPFYSDDGGGLTLKVRIGPDHALEGTLQVGLAQKRGAVYGPVRWTETAVGGDGMARLGKVRPGVYRMQRVYRPARSLPDWDPKAGRWTNAAVEITIPPGKEVVAPILHWLPAAAPKPPAAPVR